MNQGQFDLKWPMGQLKPFEPIMVHFELKPPKDLP